MKAAPVSEIRVKAGLRALEKVRDFAKEILDRYPFGEEDRFKVELSLHEISINIVLHAYPRTKGPLAVRAWLGEGGVWFEFTDEGIPFDPGAAALPDLGAKIRSGKRGGYGVFLYRTLMDGFKYRRAGGKNILAVFKRIPKTWRPRSV